MTDPSILRELGLVPCECKVCDCDIPALDGPRRCVSCEWGVHREGGVVMGDTLDERYVVEGE